MLTLFRDNFGFAQSTGLRTLKKCKGQVITLHGLQVYSVCSLDPGFEGWTPVCFRAPWPVGWHCLLILISHHLAGPTWILLIMWTLPSIAFVTIFYGSPSLLLTETLFWVFVCSGLLLLMSDVHLCVASEADKYGPNVKLWTSLWFSEIFLYCENCVSAAESFIVCVCVCVCMCVWETDTWWYVFKLLCLPLLVKNLMEAT